MPLLTPPPSSAPQVVLVGIPGAFTGTCYGTHIPDFVAHAEAIKAKVRSPARCAVRKSAAHPPCPSPQGADEIVVLGVNDFYVMKEFGKALGAGDKVRVSAQPSRSPAFAFPLLASCCAQISFIADGNGTLTAALDAEVDFSGAHFGTRTTRFSAVVEDGVVTSANVESDPGAVASSDAATILAQL